MTLFKFSHNRIVFGEGAERWSITDPESEALHEAAHAARYSPEHITKYQLLLLASAVSDYHYLATGATWFSLKTAVDKLKDIIRAVRDRQRQDCPAFNPDGSVK